MNSSPKLAPRVHQIYRSDHLGYGFIAGYEQPTMVKDIQPNGPSFGKLMMGDVIMAVNGIDVEHAPREQIIKMIQLSEGQIEIKVRQPTYEEIIRAKNLADPKFYMFNKSNPNLTPNNMQRQLPSPRQVPIATSEARNIQQYPQLILKQRTDDNICTNDSETNIFLSRSNTLGRNIKLNHDKFGRHSPQPQRCKSSMSTTKPGKNSSDEDSDQPMLKRSNTMRPIRPPAKVMQIFEVVIRIFFEDGHTRVLNYNQDTTVGTILETLNSRLAGSESNTKRCFGLALTVNSEESSREQQINKRKLLHILNETDSIIKIRQLPYAPKLRLLYRMIYPPADVCKLYSQDKVAFEYLFKQSVNDLKLERYNPMLENSISMKLAALHVIQYVYSNYPKAHGNSKDPKVYMKLIKKTPGVEHFVPISMIEATVDKKGKKIITNYKRLKSRMLEQLKANFDEFDFEPPKVKATTNLNRYTSTSFHELSLPELQSSPSDYVKLIFLSYLSQLPCYGNTKRPQRASTSPVEQASLGECSSSMESVPRTSDSSPLLKPEHRFNTQLGRTEHMKANTICRSAQMNSIRSLSSSLQPPSSVPTDRVDMAQTPSIESLSSITFNMHSSPSPQQASSHASQQSESYILESQQKHNNPEPSPMPRLQAHNHKMLDCNSIDKIYSQRYTLPAKSIDELVKSAILLPPPPMSNGLAYNMVNNRVALTPILTDQDLEGLIVPPLPRLKNYCTPN